MERKEGCDEQRREEERGRKGMDRRRNKSIWEIRPHFKTLDPPLYIPFNTLCH